VPSTTHSESRRARRRTTRAASTIRTSGSGPIDVMVLDVSATGVQIVTPAQLSLGQEISIGLAGAGATRAFVARRDGDRYGCAFDAPIGPEAAERAFSNAPVIRLGQRVAAPAAGQGGADLRELYQQHSFWRIPVDAVLVTLGMVGLGVMGWLYLT
jgi:hypothetical protein